MYHGRDLPNVWSEDVNKVSLMHRVFPGACTLTDKTFNSQKYLRAYKKTQSIAAIPVLTVNTFN
jgi:hypothetical protein